MSARRRTPLGTQPPVTSEAQTEASGEIDKTDTMEKTEHAIEVHEKTLAADQENAVIVQIDDEWLTRLELPID